MKAFRLSAIYMRGISNVTMAITVMLGTVLLMGAMSAYGYLQNARVSNEIQMLSRLKQNTLRYGQAVGAFSAANVSLQILNELGFFDDQALRTSVANNVLTVRNQWGGVVTVNVQQVVQAGDALRFEFTNVPQAVCVQVGSALDSLAVWVEVDGTFTKTRGAATNIATLTNECRGANGRTMRYTFLR